MNGTAQEEMFIRKALAKVDKAARYQLIKQIVVSVLAFAFAGWLAGRSPSSELKIECTLIIMGGLIAAICTTKIMSLVNRNTRTILQAMAEMQEGAFHAGDRPRL
ncbi:MAG TPA: hypothetical protein VH302_02405 [Bryobacteraceae bacterium]|jgi:flagellar motor component MotA|nr:hypothetical protein [Bryobacteraceae bacterium]